MDVLRSEQLADYLAVFDIHRCAFGRDNEAKLVEALRKVAHPQISLVAIRAGDILNIIRTLVLRSLAVREFAMSIRYPTKRLWCSNLNLEPWVAMQG